MELHEKIQELRKRRGLTQEELASLLFVSRTAVSKWESGRGYPSLDSLKAIASFFGITIDELLSGKELMTIAEADARQAETHVRGLVFGLLDCSLVLFFFLPFFGQTADGAIQEVSLAGLTTLPLWLKGAYFTAVLVTVLAGILTLVLRDCARWNRLQPGSSLLCSLICTFLFIISRQPYAAAFTLVFGAIKVLMRIKRP